MIDTIKLKIENQIDIASARNLTKEEISYLAGLADALEYIKETEDESLKVGQEYYVLNWNEYQNTTVVEKRELSKITITKARTAYTFSKIGKHDLHPIVLYGKGGLSSRVFSDLQDAERAKSYVYLNQKVQY